MSRYMFFTLSNNFVAIYVPNSLVIASSSWTLSYRQWTVPIFLLDDGALPRFKSLASVVTIIIHLILRSICIIFKFKYIARSFRHITTYHEYLCNSVYSPLVLLLSLSPPFRGLPLHFDRLPVSHPLCSINLFCSSRDRENNVKVDTIIWPTRDNAYSSLKRYLPSSRFS